MAMFRTMMRPRRARERRRFALEVMDLEERRLLSDMTAPTTLAQVSGAMAVTGTAVPTYETNSGTVTVDLTATDPDDVSSTLTTEFSTDNGFTFTKGSTITLTSAGTYNIKYFSVDPAGNVETLHSLVVQIGQAVSNQTPTITVAANPNSLWPPNHKDVPVTVSGTFTTATAPASAGATTRIDYNVDDEYSPGGPIITGTTQSSPAVNNGNGTYSYHYQFTVSLEASRHGQDKDGRTYTINVSAVDTAGAPLASNSTTVVVPHDQGHGGGGGDEDDDEIDRDFIDGVFLVVLGRVCDQGGEDFFAHQMQIGMTPAQVISALQRTPEYANRVVTQLYQNVLGRAPDPSGLATFTGWIEAGATPRMVEQALLTSPEFNADHPDNAGFITAAYQAILGRTPDAAGQAYFTGLLNAGVTRDVIISDLLYSSEADRNLVHETFGACLNRSADQSGEAFFVNGLQHGTVNANIIVIDLMTSPEFFVNMTGTTQVAVHQNSGGGNQDGGNNQGDGGDDQGGGNQGGGNQGGHGHGNGNGHGKGHGHGNGHGKGHG